MDIASAGELPHGQLRSEFRTQKSRCLAGGGLMPTKHTSSSHRRSEYLSLVASRLVRARDRNACQPALVRDQDGSHRTAGSPMHSGDNLPRYGTYRWLRYPRQGQRTPYQCLRQWNSSLSRLDVRNGWACGSGKGFFFLHFSRSFFSYCLDSVLHYRSWALGKLGKLNFLVHKRL